MPIDKPFTTITLCQISKKCNELQDDDVRVHSHQKTFNYYTCLIFPCLGFVVNQLTYIAVIFHSLLNPLQSFHYLNHPYIYQMLFSESLLLNHSTWILFFEDFVFSRAKVVRFIVKEGNSPFSVYMCAWLLKLIYTEWDASILYGIFSLLRCLGYLYILNLWENMIYFNALVQDGFNLLISVYSSAFLDFPSYKHKDVLLHINKW